MAKYLSIFFDVEALGPEMIGKVKHGLWRVDQWDLDENLEPIIESSIKLGDRMGKAEAIKFAQKVKKTIPDKVYISSKTGRFKIMPIWYENLAY